MSDACTEYDEYMSLYLILYILRTWQKEINFANTTDNIAYYHNAIVRDSKYLAACVSFVSPSTVPPVKGKNVWIGNTKEYK